MFYLIMTKKKIAVVSTLIFSVLCEMTGIGNAAPINGTTETAILDETPIQPCPCVSQPEGIIMAHPTDCRAYMTCLSSSNVRYSKCGRQDEVFHPYLRTCVQRSKFATFVPVIIPTKDLCKIPSVFRSPSTENFDGCRITYDGNSTQESQSDEDIYSNNNDNTIGDDVSIGNSNELGRNGTLLSTWNSAMNFGRASSGSSKPALSTPTTSSPVEEQSRECHITKIIVQHFPAPCQANITCANGITFSIRNCQNVLNLQSS